MQKDQRLELRLTQTDKQLLSLAARDVQKPLSAFLRDEAIKAARKRLLEEQE